MPGRHIIVIGGSSGALEALRHVVSALPAGLPAAVFVAMHTSRNSPGLVDRILSRAGRLPARYAVDGDPIRPGAIVIAPPDRHLVLKRDHVRVTRGPREHRFRPALDPLFRTAALAHRAAVIGVVLSGGQDDGAAGLGLIKHYGGMAIVQSPDDALAPGMPQSAIRHVRVDHVLPAAAIAERLVALVEEPITLEVFMGELPRDVAETGAHDIHRADRLGAPAPFSCPDCGGTLWEQKDGDLLQYQCHVGHRFGGDSLATAKSEELDQALWVALRALEENAALWSRMARNAGGRGMTDLAVQYQNQSDESEQRAGIIRRVLMPEAEEVPGEAVSPRAASGARRDRSRDRS